ncbi:MAG: malto-oligosyltrehalose synthase [Desulfotomaculum sp. BICA1-6]|nr:MAG: malto-oligosyltrehalose synthase [Peptococcaceae bacterium BRH_c8a]KJS72487.1 MAG: malto-oligosyltrehalose synthase [Desulfotomaculum sp. BICA1-6]
MRIPSATYRFQFNGEFSFEDARALVPYLYQLGVTDIYASPLLQAKQGSGHGYDLADPTRVNRELGGDEAFFKLAETLRQQDMGLVLDIVPNHMAASVENPWWADVLQHGPDSPYAGYFDIDWQTSRSGMAGKVLLPVLGSPYGQALENGELTLLLTKNGFGVQYYGDIMPVRPGSYRLILGPGPIPPQLGELMTDLDKLPPRGDTGYTAAWRKITDLLWQLYRTDSKTKSFVDHALLTINGIKGQPDSFAHLEKLLAEQHYRLAFWRTANREINYRRFFSISELVSMRVEDEHVFAATHGLIFHLARAGLVTGLRIDHIDGLHDPNSYLCRLQERLTGAGERPGFYVVVEKILGMSNNERGPSVEELPAEWPVHGTSGYDFLNQVNGLFVHDAGLAELSIIYRRHGGPAASFAETIYSLKKRAMASLFGGEMRTLAEKLGRLAEQDRHGVDLTLNQLEDAVVEVIACFPVYRTYTNSLTVTARDRVYIEQALALALQRNPGVARAVSFLRRVLLLDDGINQPRKQQQAWLQFVMRWQQFTGPVTAKGVEDAAMYVHNRLLSINEVGSEPDNAVVSVAEFHRRNYNRLERHPHTMNATATHDTKRGEDVRMRINVLSEIPALWAERLALWRRWNDRHKPLHRGHPVPGGNMEQFIYQTLVGAWPLSEGEVPEFKERLADYLVKAAREAGMHTSWLQPDENYEKALVQFAMSILEPGESNLFLRDFTPFQAYISYYGAINSLAQVLLKVTCPGVPDFYRGTELWDFSLVDPDNRRPVDFDARAAILDELREREADGRVALTALARELLESWRDGRVKLFLAYRALQFRRNRADLFTHGEYVPVEASGPGAGHVCAFARRSGTSWALVAVPRMTALLGTGYREPDTNPLSLHPGETMWGNTFLLLPGDAPGLWRNLLTQETMTAGTGPEPKVRVLPLNDLWRCFPVALLAGV